MRAGLDRLPSGHDTRGLAEAGIMYRMSGLNLEPDENGVRRFVGSVQWWTDAPDHRWLNKRFGLEVGAIDPDGTLTSPSTTSRPADLRFLVSR